MNNIVGQPVEGEDFFGREGEVLALAEIIKQGNHVLLLAPRRVGKTSLALATGAAVIADGWKFVLVDAQKDRDELSFIANVLENLKSGGLKVPILARLTEGVAWLRRTAKGKIEGYGVSVELGTDGGKEVATLENLVQQLFEELESSGNQVLIVVDELPVLLSELERENDDCVRLRNFLNWFRCLRLRYRKNVRWLLLGSVGLDSFVEALGLTATINDLQTSSLGAYNSETATSFLQALGADKKIVMSNEVCAAILAEVGWPLPFFLQLVFQRLYAKLGRPPRNPEVGDVHVACEQLISSDFYKHFEPWRGRLAEGLGPDEHKAALTILNSLAANTGGLNRTVLRNAVQAKFPQRDSADTSRLLSTVLEQLERDGYVLKSATSEGTNYAFRSFLLRKYWFAREVA